MFISYKQARSNFQKIRRHAQNLKNINLNNQLMYSCAFDSNKYFKLIKKVRGVCQGTTKNTAALYTPVGEYFGKDILEGFASDAEYLGRHVGDMSEYDNEFYKLCK